MSFLKVCRYQNDYLQIKHDSKCAELFRSTQQTLNKLRIVHNNIVYSMLTMIKNRIISSMSKGHNYCIIHNPHKDADLQGIHHLKILRGTYNRYSRTYDRNIHLDAGISLDPITEINYRLKNNDILVTDISDPSKSFAFVIKVTWK